MTSNSNKSPKITPVILAGGQGRRLWPLSRKEKPKQFLSLLSKDAMLRQTCQRCTNTDIFNAPVILGALDNKEMLTKHAPPNTTIILEPMRKNTASSVCLATLNAVDPDEVLLILPSDHYIDDTNAFNEAISRALSNIMKGQIVTFGVSPKSPHTGYGYIRRGEKQGEGYKVENFHEKPNKETAGEYLRLGEYYWNAGIFMAKASVLHDEFKSHANQLYATIQRAWQQKHEVENYILPDATIYASITPEPFDVAIAEKSDRMSVIPAGFSWRDIGDWNALCSVKLDQIKRKSL